MRHVIRNTPGALLALAVAAALVGCGGRQETGVPAGLAPGMVVERFLQAANQAAPPSGSQLCRSAEALATMGRLFGTVEGPILETRDRTIVDRWMCAVASVLRHDDYELIGEGVVPGRTESAQQIVVRLTARQERREVPFLVIRSRTGSWLVEQVDLESALGPR